MTLGNAFRFVSGSLMWTIPNRVFLTSHIRECKIKFIYKQNKAQSRQLNLEISLGKDDIYQTTKYFTYRNTNSLYPQHVAFPQIKDQLARLNVQREVYNDYLFDLRVLNGFQQLRSADHVMSKNFLARVFSFLLLVVCFFLDA